LLHELHGPTLSSNYILNVLALSAFCASYIAQEAQLPQRTERHAMLANSCYVLRATGVIIKFSNSKSDLVGHSRHWQWCHLIGHIRFPMLILSLISLNLKISY